jgi:hypothetical protein
MAAVLNLRQMVAKLTQSGRPPRLAFAASVGDEPVHLEQLLEVRTHRQIKP